MADTEISNDELAKLVEDIANSSGPINASEIVALENVVLRIQKKLQTFIFSETSYKLFINTVAETDEIQQSSLVTLSKSLSQTKLEREQIDSFLKKSLEEYDQSRSKHCSMYVNKLTDEKIEGKLLERFIESINNPNITKEEVIKLKVVAKITLNDDCKKISDDKNHLCDGTCTKEMMEQIIQKIKELDDVKKTMTAFIRKMSGLTISQKIWDAFIRRLAKANTPENQGTQAIIKKLNTVELSKPEWEEFLKTLHDVDGYRHFFESMIKWHVSEEELQEIVEDIVSLDFSAADDIKSLIKKKIKLKVPKQVLDRVKKFEESASHIPHKNLSDLYFINNNTEDGNDTFLKIKKSYYSSISLSQLLFRIPVNTREPENLTLVNKVFNWLTLNQIPNLYAEDTEDRAFLKRDLFLWAILNNYREYAKEIWKKMDGEYIVSALTACILLKSMADKMHTTSMNERGKIMIEDAKYYENGSRSILSECYKINPKAATSLLVQNHPAWGNKSLFFLAKTGELMDFTEEDCFQAKLSEIWKGNKSLKYNGAEICTSLLRIFKIPVVKFILFTISYIVF